MTNQITHQFHTLQSGLRLITIPMPVAHTATVLVLVGCGSVCESRELSGVSHFLEHMMFKGTTKRPGYSDINRELESIGARSNAFTGKEETGYYATAASAKFNIISDVIYDIFLNSKLEQGAMEIERGPIIEEIRMRRDDPQSHIWRVFEGLLYGDQPAGREIGGTEETVKAMQSQDLRKWFDTHYVAENTVIAVAGNVDADQVFKQAEEMFAHIRQAPTTALPPTVQDQKSPAVKTEIKDVEQLYVKLGVRGYSRFDDRRYALSLLANILGGGMSSRLFEEVREKRGLAYSIYANDQFYNDAGYFVVSAGLNQPRASEGIKVILDELMKVATSGVTQEELKRAKDCAEGSLAFMLESSMGLAESYGAGLLSYGKIVTPSDELEKIKAVTAEQIQAVAQDIFKESQLNLAAIGPKVTNEQFESILKF